MARLRQILLPALVRHLSLASPVRVSWGETESKLDADRSVSHNNKYWNDSR